MIPETPNPKKPFIVANVRELLDMKRKVSYSKFVEMLNEMVEQWRKEHESPEPQEELWEEAKEQRDLFCSVINKQEWNTELRTACDSLLIMYDNLMNTLTRKQNTP